MDQFNSIDFGIVNYNGAEALLECVRSIQKMNGNIQVRIFVCDNASSDNSIKLLQESKLNCTIDCINSNLGYAGACNRLLEKMTAPIQVLCNMDLQFDPKWGTQVVDSFQKHPECGSIASLVLEPGNVINALGVLFFPDMHAVNEKSGEILSETDLQERYVFGCYGAVMAFRREVVEKIGLFDDSFFLFYEETEWYIRHYLAGFKTLLNPKAIVHHERSKTTIRYSTLKLFYSERNRIRCAVRYLPWKSLILLPWNSFQRYLSMLQGGIPSQDASGKKNSKMQLAETLFSAWIKALFSFQEWRTRRRLRKQWGKDYRKQVQNMLYRYLK